MKANDFRKRAPKTRALIVAILLGWMAPHGESAAATLPAGTTVVVTTVDALSSHESRGRTFKTRLAHDLKVGGKAVVAAGTTIFGVVESSRDRMNMSSSSPLTVNLKSIEMNGKRIAIKTTGGVAPGTLGAGANAQKRTGVSVGKSMLPSGTKLQFHLAEPLSL